MSFTNDRSVGRLVGVELVPIKPTDPSDDRHTKRRTVLSVRYWSPEKGNMQKIAESGPSYRQAWTSRGFHTEVLERDVYASCRTPTDRYQVYQAGFCRSHKVVFILCRYLCSCCCCCCCSHARWTLEEGKELRIMCVDDPLERTPSGALPFSAASSAEPKKTCKSLSETPERVVPSPTERVVDSNFKVEGTDDDEVGKTSILLCILHAHATRKVLAQRSGARGKTFTVP